MSAQIYAGVSVRILSAIPKGQINGRSLGLLGPQASARPLIHTRKCFSGVWVDADRELSSSKPQKFAA